MEKYEMHVLMTTDTVGGVWTYTMHLISALAAGNVRVTLISLGVLPTKTQLQEMKDLANVEIVPTPFKLEWMKDSDSDVEDSKRFIIDVADHVNPDVFHSNQFCFGTLRLGIPKIVVAHSDMLSWWSWKFHNGSSDFELQPFLLDYQQKVRRALLASDAIVCPSSFMADNMRRFYDSGLRQLKVIYNGAPAGSPPPKYFRKRKTAVTVGRLWDQGKNAACVVEAARSLPGMEFVLVGPTTGPDGNKLDVDPPANVALPGRRTPEQVWKLLEKSAVYIGPSIYEPFGLSPLEAAMSNCALVLSDTPSFREIWEDAALYFPPDSPDILTRQLESLTRNPDLICRHATMARFRAFQYYTAERMGAQYLELYRSLIKTSHHKISDPQQMPHAC